MYVKAWEELDIIFLNSNGCIDGLSSDLQAFLSYLNGHISDNPFVSSLDDEVQRTRA